MSNYTKSTDFASKDTLPSGDSAKIVRGTEIDAEFEALEVAVATKTDNSAAAITGGTITGITDLAIADGGTGASTASGARTNLGLGSLALKSTVETADISDANVTVAKLSATGTASSSTFLRGDGAWQTPVSPIGRQVFTSSGTFTIPSGVTAVKVTVVGGGGGGGGGAACGNPGGGGGGGAALIKYLTGLTSGNTLAVTVGAAGAGGVNGTTGGTSSVASGTQSITTLTCTGGAGGVSQASATYRAGGTATNGDINANGGPSEYTGGAGQKGGDSGLGMGIGGWGATGFSTSPTAGTGYGGGGGGGYPTPTNGAAGSAGIVIFEW
jgi:hypothetical protein